MKGFNNDKNFHIFLLVMLVPFFIWSAINPDDYLEWTAKVTPALLGVGVLIITYKHYKFTNFTYLFIYFHILFLFYASQGSYSLEPVFAWISKVLGWQRNYFDRLGHFLQGAVPAVITRELFISKGIVKDRRWLFAIVMFSVMTVASVWEIIEFAGAKIAGQTAEEFLRVQGDEWDSQWDMTFALFGGLAAQFALSGILDRKIALQVKKDNQ